MLNIHVGYSDGHIMDLAVLEHSIRRRSSIPIDIKYVPEHEIVLNRQRDFHQTTPFSFSRFLVPALWGYKGFSVFMDPDMLCLCDVKELYDAFDPQYAVQVVKHDYVPRTSTKYIGSDIKPQYPYARKNWSSLIIFNNEKCKDIYPFDVVNSAPGLALHAFANIDPSLVGELPKEFNVLVNEDNQAEEAKIAHFTNGMPYIDGYKEGKYADLWLKEQHHYLASYVH